MNKPERKRRGPLTWLAGRSRRFWIVAALALPVMYVASIGPAARWFGGGVAGPVYFPPPWPIVLLYAPIDWLANTAPEPIPSLLSWYVSLWRS